MAKEGVDALHVTSPPNLLYCLGFKLETESHLVLPIDGEPVYLVSPLDFQMASDFMEGSGVRLEKMDGAKPQCSVVAQLLVEARGKSEGKKIGFEQDFLPVSKYEALKGALEKERGQVELVGAQEVLTRARVRKTPEEVENIRKACQIVDRVLELAFDQLEPGTTERELAAELEYNMRKLGGERAGFETIVASGHRSWYPHGTSSDKKIEEGDVVTVDLGVVYRGYHSDTTRTRVLGKPDPKVAEVVNQVNEAQRLGVKAVKPGVPAREVDEACRGYFRNLGRDKYFIHGTGHGVGVEIHESPRIAASSTDVLEPGMVFTVEPGLYLPGVGGARTEDVVHVTENGAEVLTLFPIVDY